MNKVDLIILGVIVLFMIVGYARGLIGTVLNLAQYLIALFLSVKFAPLFSNILIKAFKLDGIILNWVYDHPDAINGVISSMSNELLQSIVGRIISVISLILLFIIIKIVFGLIVAVLNKIAQLPILNEINKIGGIIVGAIEGVLIVYIAILLVNWLPISSLNLAKELLSTSAVGAKISEMVPNAATEIIELSGVKKKV